MKLKVTFDSKENVDCKVKIILIYHGDVDGAGKAKTDRLLKKFGITPGLLSRYNFMGLKNEVFELYPRDYSDSVFIVAGLGSKKRYVSDYARQVGGAISNLLVKRKIKTIAVTSMPDYKNTLPAFVEGLILGGYSFKRFKSKKSSASRLNLILDKNMDRYKKEIDRSVVLAEAACLTRDLVNTPANYLTPTTYAGKAKALARKYGISIRVYNQQEIVKLKMGALLGVAKGSAQPPRLINWIYNGGRKSAPPIVLVGKGVTFDTGGISLKPNESMIDMKNDMAGSAAVISQMEIVGRLKPKVNVVGIVPAVENMPSGNALKPSDILTASDGQTIEVLNTDAEGRLILADALCFAHRFKPKEIIDIATLTGAAKYALGTKAAAILGTGESILQKLYKIGQKTAEKTWQLPLWDEYHEQIKSEIADMKNVGGRPAGTITAAAFLSKFVKDIPWAHIDIASMDNMENKHPYIAKGATGFGTRLLGEYLLSSR